MVSGVWVTPIQFKMYDTITHTTRMLFLPQAPIMAPNEIEDMVEEGKEMFLDYLKGKGAHQEMPREQQHEFGPHLRQIEQSNRRFREVGHGRYW